jgi:outer membrane protein TolC
MIPSRFFAAALLLSPLALTSASAQGADTIRLSATDALTRVLRESDEIRIGQAQLEVTGAQVTQARASGLPALNLRGSYTQQVRNARATIVSGSIFGQNYTYTTTLALSQPVFQGGRIFAGMRAANDAREASRQTFAETRSRLTLAAQSAYLGAILARELVQIQEENAKLADARLTQVQQLERAGRASRYDLLKARVDRANLEPALLQARSNRELADIELKQLLNYPGDAPIVLTSELDTASLREAVATIVSSVSNGYVSRSSVRAAEATVDARHEGVRIARADFMPTFTVFLNNGYTALPSTSGFPTVWGHTSAANCAPGSDPTRVCQNNGWYPDRSFGVQMAWPLFDGLRTKGSVDLASAQERVARAQLEQAREQATVEVARARAEFARAEATFNAQQQNTNEADEAYRIAALRFERGLGTQLEVNDAQFSLLTARVNAARATIDYYLAAAELARSHGREVPPPPMRPSAATR